MHCISCWLICDRCNSLTVCVWNFVQSTALGWQWTLKVSGCHHLLFAFHPLKHIAGAPVAGAAADVDIGLGKVQTLAHRVVAWHNRHACCSQCPGSTAAASTTWATCLRNKRRRHLRSCARFKSGSPTCAGCFLYAQSMRTASRRPATSVPSPCSAASSSCVSVMMRLVSAQI